MTSESADVLSVWLGDTLVGQLTRNSEGSTFVLDEDYLSQPRRPVLGQLFEDDPTARHWVRQGTPVWFSNLLPEGRLRDLIARRAGVHTTRGLHLLELIGLDLPGAVIVRREGEAPDAPPDDADDVSSDEQPLLKFSLAGVQLKFSGNRAGRGLTIPVHGRGGDWILKLPDERHVGVPENEYSMMRWAALAGIEVPEVELISVADVHGLPDEAEAMGELAYAVKRFDRAPGGKVHTEDLAQVLGRAPTTKYEQTSYDHLARVVDAVSPDDIDEFVRRLVFIVLSGNGDAHMKNWSLIYRDGRTARLSPAYDLVSTVPYLPRDALGLALGKVKVFDRVDGAAFARFAARAELDEGRVAATVQEQVRATVGTWATHRDEFPAHSDVKREIDRRLAELPLARAYAN